MGLAKDHFIDAPIEPTLSQDLQSLSVRMQIVAGRMLESENINTWSHGTELAGAAKMVNDWAKEMKND